MTTSAAPRTMTVQPFWSRWAGLGITVGGSLLLIATVMEWSHACEETSTLILVITVLLLTSTLAHAAAMIPLAFGRDGADGAVGRSLVGKVSLLIFGAAFFINQVGYFLAAHTLPAQDDYTAFQAFQLTLGLLQFLALLAGAIVIAREGIATGGARWALLALAVVAIAGAALIQSTDDLDIVTLLLFLSTAAQVVTGVVYLCHRQRITLRGSARRRQRKLP